MPHIAVMMYPGRDEEVKKNLAHKIHALIVEELKVPEGGTEKAPTTMTVHYFYEQYQLFYNPYN